MKTINDKIISKVKKASLQIDANSQLILFGSQARSNATKESDWDFLLLTSKPVYPEIRMELIKKIHAIELEEDVAVQVLMKELNEWENKYSVTPLYKNIQEQGVVV